MMSLCNTGLIEMCNNLKQYDLSLKVHLLLMCGMFKQHLAAKPTANIRMSKSKISNLCFLVGENCLSISLSKIKPHCVFF